jgi:hypothetical protein
MTNVLATDDTVAKKDNLKNFFTSYDLNYLNSTVGESPSMPKPVYSTTTVDKDENMDKSFPSMRHETKKEIASERPVPLLHTILPASFLPRAYGSSKDEEAVQRSHSMAIDDEDGYCHTCPDFNNTFEEDQQPHTLTPSDTYTTVSMSQSYMWDDDEEDEEGEYCMSPAESVFRRSESDASASPSAPSFSEKTHEAYNFLLRMKPQNYIQGSSSDDCDHSNPCGFSLHYNDDEARPPSLSMPHLEQISDERTVSLIIKNEL